MPEPYVKVVAAAVVLALLVQVVTARSLTKDGDEFISEQRQLLGNLLPVWLDRLRNIPSLLRVTIRFLYMQTWHLTMKDYVQPTVTPDSPRAKKPVEVLNWPSIELDVGQITGVAVDESSNPVILHRGNVKWTGGYIITSVRRELYGIIKHFSL